MDVPLVVTGGLGLLSIAATKDIRHMVGVYTYLTNKPKPIAAIPTYTSKDVSVIIPTTFKTPSELMVCIARILRCKPTKIFVVTADANVDLVVESCVINNIDLDKVAVLGIEKLNKRNQILAAAQHIETEITILADDDVFWPPKFLENMLAIFEDLNVGAGGPRQRVKRNSEPDMWNILGIAYLERRVFNNCATNAIDGSISTLSGRTAAYRSKILKDPAFQYYFTHDSWRGKPLNSDDDKCLTRWIYKQGWKIVLQWEPSAAIETTVEGDAKYLDQCMRWARAHWRGNFTVMENETYWRSRTFWWGLWFIYVGQFQTPSLIIDGLRFMFLAMILMGCSASGPVAYAAFGAMAAALLIDKNLKMIPHFRKYPQDMRFIPVLILFSYFHGFLNVRALFTMQQTHWGSQHLEVLQEARLDTPLLISEAGEVQNGEFKALLGDSDSEESSHVDSPMQGSAKYGLADKLSSNANE